MTATDDMIGLVRGLVDISRAAQPPKIFAVDPRVRRAIAFLAARETGTRVPDVTRDPVDREVEVLLSETPVDLGEASSDDQATVAFARELAFQDVLGVAELGLGPCASPRAGTG